MARELPCFGAKLCSDQLLGAGGSFLAEIAA